MFTRALVVADAHRSCVMLTRALVVTDAYGSRYNIRDSLLCMPIFMTEIDFQSNIKPSDASATLPGARQLATTSLENADVLFLFTESSIREEWGEDRAALAAGGFLANSTAVGTNTGTTLLPVERSGEEAALTSVVLSGFTWGQGTPRDSARLLPVGPLVNYVDNSTYFRSLCPVFPCARASPATSLTADPAEIVVLTQPLPVIHTGMVESAVRVRVLSTGGFAVANEIVTMSVVRVGVPQPVRAKQFFNDVALGGKGNDPSFPVLRLDSQSATSDANGVAVFVVDIVSGVSSPSYALLFTCGRVSVTSDTFTLFNRVVPASITPQGSGWTFSGVSSQFPTRASLGDLTVRIGLHPSEYVVALFSFICVVLRQHECQHRKTLRKQTSDVQE